VQPPTDLPKPRELVVAAWNIERCKRVEQSADLLRGIGADIVLATEMDHGMARSGQRHVTRDLARELGFGYAYGVEFVELGTGDAYETGLFADVANDNGLHGNAILSRYPLIDVKVILLDDSGMWYTGTPKSGGQRRVGGRMAIAARVDMASGPVTLVAVHYESETDAQGRRAQTQVMLDGLDCAYGTGRAVIGGDLNTSALTGFSAADCLSAPARAEPCFDAFAEAGFAWQGANTGGPTTRAAPGKQVRYPLLRLDWLFLRGLQGLDPGTCAAVSSHGDYLSDHELITVRVAP
jgi:endonuclease/exonuclease/phosphatase family metal-dependent hydrolase